MKPADSEFNNIDAANPHTVTIEKTLRFLVSRKPRLSNVKY
jgi:hypothetical protein